MKKQSQRYLDWGFRKKISETELDWQGSIFTIKQYWDTEDRGFEVYFHRDGEFYRHVSVQRQLTDADIVRFLEVFWKMESGSC